jgi:hypothetical protein
MLEVDITAGEFNNESYDFTITSGGNPYDITSKTINMFLKTAAGDSDTAGSTVKLSTATGEIVITNGPGGAATVAWPLLSTTTTPGFYRIEVIVSGKAHTALYGKIGITPL